MKINRIFVKAIFKFNGGAGALLCSTCHVIIKTGKDFTEEESKAFKGETKLGSQICNKCKAKDRDMQINEIIKD